MALKKYFKYLWLLVFLLVPFVFLSSLRSQAPKVPPTKNLTASGTTLTILNGTTDPELSESLANDFTQFGFKHVYFGPATSTTNPETTIKIDSRNSLYLPLVQTLKKRFTSVAVLPAESSRSGNVVIIVGQNQF